MNGPSRRSVLRSVAQLVAVALLVAPLRVTAAETAPLAIKGYDAVAYFSDGKPVRGSPAIEYEWDEYRYRFSSTKHLEMFKADPTHYAPRFANFCAMALSEGEVEEANPKYWLIRDGKLYLFGDRTGPKVFQRDLAGNITNAERNRTLIQKN
jgi:YHS domain-containing protein